MTEIEIIRTISLADNSYLLVAGDEAALVDPQRDCWRVLRSCEERGITVRYTLETHVHNDYVSGAMEVRAATGARIVAPALGRYTFDHLAVEEGDEIDLNGLTLTALATPGHTPEHTAYLVREPGHELPLAIFTGGSLLVGSAGRTDLLGDRMSPSLTRAQYQTLARLSDFPDATRVLPTHGTGSFCGTTATKAQATDDVTSTIGRERATNPAMSFADADTFARERLKGLPPYPAYYRHMAPINRSGAAVLGAQPTLKPLSPLAVRGMCEDGAWVVDGRDRASFAAAHLPGSLNVELDNEFGSYVGWTVPFGAPVVLVLPNPVARSMAEAAAQLTRIGYERIVGYLSAGIEGWHDDGGAVRSYPVAAATQLAGRDGDIRAGNIHVIDVRTPQERSTGAIPGSMSCFVGDLPDRISGIPRDRPVWTVCASGRRAAIAASLLDREGVAVTAVTSGGVAEVLAATAQMSHEHR